MVGWRAGRALVAPPRIASASLYVRQESGFWNEPRAVRTCDNTLTHPSLWAGSTLSRTAGEGAERSEAGEGLGELRALRPPGLARARGLRQERTAGSAAR